MTGNELLQAIYENTQELKQRTSSIESDITELKQRTSSIESDITSMKSDIIELKQCTSKIEDNVANMKVTLENELRVNIQRIAEGHLDLSRNMHEVIKPNAEIEMLAIKVRMLETDMRGIKLKIS